MMKLPENKTIINNKISYMCVITTYMLLKKCLTID